jgi:tetratricopeptide (TPR) repeat protein
MPEEKKPALEFVFTVRRRPDGVLDPAEAERMILADLEQGRSTRKQALWNLAVLHDRTDRHDQALDYIKKLALIADGPEEQAASYLALGQLHERVQDYVGAASYYRGALETKPGEKTPTWYWIHNNLGYCLIQIGQFKEAETYLKAALEIDPHRPNAFKNVGLALVGQGEYAKAIEHFVRATQVNASDARSLKHFEEVVEAHPELLVAAPDLQQQLDACRKAVEYAASHQLDPKTERKKN